MSAQLFNSLLKESLNETNVIVKTQSDNIVNAGNHNDVNVDDNNNAIVCNDNVNTCLITGEPLTDNYITLACNHSFNYIPLMKERAQWRYNYKNKYYCYENKINMNVQTVCPYCRTVTEGILPWFNQVDGVDIEKVKWVNWPKSAWYLKNKCLYRFSSGKRKGECCGKGAFEMFCSQHEKFKDRYDENGNPIVKKKKKKAEQSGFSCMHVISRGKRKGLCCGKKAKARKQESTGFLLYHCSSHYKYYL